jgi:hypothetical protein
MRMVCAGVSLGSGVTRPLDFAKTSAVLKSIDIFYQYPTAPM